MDYKIRVEVNPEDNTKIDVFTSSSGTTPYLVQTELWHLTANGAIQMPDDLININRRTIADAENTQFTIMDLTEYKD